MNSSLPINQSPDRVLITVSEAARRLNLYPTAVNRWIERGVLEAFRIEGKRNRYVDAEQVALLAREPIDPLSPGRPRRTRRFI